MRWAFRRAGEGAVCNVGVALPPSLRAQRSNPVGDAALDCFVASLLAMTVSAAAPKCSRHVVRLVAVEDALERIEVPLRRRRPFVEAVAADVALGFFDHCLGQLFEPFS